MTAARTQRFFAWILMLGLWPVGPALGAPPQTSTEGPPTLAEELYDAGLTKLREGELKEAKAAFEKSRRLDPTAAEPLLGLAEVAFKKGQLEEVRRYVGRALEVAPHSAAAHTAWGRYQYLKGEYLKAEEAFRTAVGLDPRLAEPHIELGALYLVRLGQPGKAVEAYRRAVALKPDEVELRYALASALARVDDVDGAAGVLEDAAELVPGNPYPWQLLGTIYATDGAYGEALAAFDKALQKEPKLVQARWARGEVYLALGEDEKALQEYKRALEDNPDFAPAWVKIGMIHERHQHADEAEQAYLRAVALDPELGVAYNNLAFGAAQRGERLDDALRWAQRALELAPDNPAFQDTLGWVHRARGELSQAVSVLERAAAVSSDAPDILYHLGVVYAEAGRPDEAKATLKKALEFGDFPEADKARAYLASLSNS